MVHEISFNGIGRDEMKEFLDEKHDLYNNTSFIENDPVSIPHRFDRLQDIEISGFLSATIAWGRRDLILRGAGILLEKMENAPHYFVTEAPEDEFEVLSDFVYRTFNGVDCVSFMKSLRNIYLNYSSMEDIIVEGMADDGELTSGMRHLRKRFFSECHPARSEKHFADISRGAAGKRLNMFLRWMVRNDNRGVDFGIWKRISPSQLYIPLDFHSGNTARKLGLLQRRASDWKAVIELTEVLREFDPDDPVKYDFALFGLGINEKFR
ncbi:MAG: TIGR02757 family protein [Bacteroidales bacterium]|jgi:uncharacterized protein (TIGR02757 family)|nr:TIGR02757 family protein [Bacteroidales bacterium]